MTIRPDGMSEAEIAQAVEAFRAFAEDVLILKVPGRRIPFRLRDAQLETVADIIGNRNVIILKARQIGFSALIAGLCLWFAMGGADRQIYMLSKGQREARALLHKSRYAYRMLPSWVRDKGPALTDRTLERMSFENESFIVSSQSASDPIRGETAWLAVVDEWASINDQEGAWAAIEPTADLGGRIVGLSTAKGEGDFFHERWVAATSGNSNFHPIFHSWRAVPERNEAWYADKVANNPKWFVAQEYPSSPEDAFIGSGNPFFDLEPVRLWELREPTGFFNVEFVDKVGNIIESPRGELAVWLPRDRDGNWKFNPKSSYVVGADVAMGLDRGDWSVAYVLEAVSGEIVGMWRGRVAPDVFGNQILPGIGSFFKNALVNVEINNHGLTTLTALRDCGYENLYRRHSKTTRRETTLETLGWLTTSANKQPMADGIAAWIRNGNQAYDRTTIHEIKTFVREQRGERIKLHGSPHDDCVMALGITIECRRYAHEHQMILPTPDRRGTIEWLDEQLQGGRSKGRKSLSPVL
jgi:hypothetical protein